MMTTTTTSSTLVLMLCLAICQFAAGENVVVPAEQCKPQQIHLAYGDTIKDMVIMWSTVSGQCTTEVKYGDGPWNLESSTPGESRSLDGASNLNGLHYIHRVKLQDLEPGKTYFYEPVSNDVIAGPFFFRTPLESATELELLVISEVSTSSQIFRTLSDEKQSGKYAAVLHTGNIALNLNSANGTNGDLYLKRMETTISGVPYLTSPGPAEVEKDESFTNYLRRFSMPQTNWPMSLDKMWYSIDIGPVHLISYSTEVFFTSNGLYTSMQHDWLIKDLKLANKNREAVPWIVAFGNVPMYCSYEDPDLLCNQKVSKVKSELEDIFYHFGVDIAIQSYGKAYERSYPMYKGVQVSDNYTNPLGPIHIMNGGATSWKMEYNFTAPDPGWTAFRFINNTITTYGRLHVINASMATYEAVDIQDGSVIDSFTITQDKHGQFNTAILPEDISAEIDKKIVDAGGKPGVLNIEEVGSSNTNSGISALLDKDNRTRLIIGVSCAVFMVIVIFLIIFVKMRRRRRRVTRRWEQMDINYGKKFYSKAPDKDEDNDFEIDMSDGTEPTRKLLNAGD